MKAAQISEYGDTSVIKVNEVDKPTLKNGQVMVQVRAASLNPFDTMVRAGYMKDSIPLSFPVTIGGDLAGEVIEVAKDVTNVMPGDKVYGSANAVAGNSGAFAEYAITSANQLSRAPSNITFEEAAALPLVGVSAIQALTQHINLQPGQKILITGGAGGIGRIAIQLAKHIGAHVATTATEEGIEIAKSLGADEVIDYKLINVTQELKDYDAVFDTVGGDQINDLLEVLKSGAIAVTMSGSFDEKLASDKDIKTISQFTRINPEALEKLAKLVEDGVVKPGVGKIFKLEDVQAAFEARENGEVNGKIVLAIK